MRRSHSAKPKPEKKTHPECRTALGWEEECIASHSLLLQNTSRNKLQERCNNGGEEKDKYHIGE